MSKLKLALAIILIIAALVVSGCCCCVVPCRHSYTIPRYSEVSSPLKAVHGTPTAGTIHTKLPI